VTNQPTNRPTTNSRQRTCQDMPLTLRAGAYKNVIGMNKNSAIADRAHDAGSILLTQSR